MEKRDFYRQSEGQVWPQISAATQGLLRPTPTCYLRPWGWGSRFGEGQFPLSCTCWFAHWEDVAAPRQPEDPVSRSTRTCWDPFCLLWSSPSSPFGLSLLHPRTLCLQPTLRTQLTWGAGTKHPGETPPQAGSRHARRAGRGHMTGTPAPRRLLPLPHPRRFPLRGGCRCRPPRPAPFRPGRPPLEPYQPVASGPALPGERDSDLESGPHHFGGSASRSPRHYFSTSRRCPQRGRQGRLTNRNLLRARPAQTRCVKVPGRSLRLRSPGGPRGAALPRCFLSTFLEPGRPVSELQGPFCLPAWPLLVF